jgi:2-isopropylmalate synthase
MTASRSSDSVLLYDTTLRDGTQSEGVVVSLADKLRIVRRLDEFGFPYIEGGWPGSNPKDVDFFAAAKGLTLRTARLAAFGATRHKDLRAADDPNLAALIAAETPVVTIFGKSWLLHVRSVLGATPQQNLAMIGDSVSHLALAVPEVIYDAEHYFDGFADDPDYALATLRAARDGGARTLVLCDTNGGTLPGSLTAIIKATRAALESDEGGLNLVWGIHVHNDGELAVANSLAAIEAGVRHVQGTINGYGERCGNANLISILADLALKTSFDVVPGGNLGELTGLSRFVAELVNLAPDDHAPYVGRSAFAHKGGVHGAAVVKEPRAYEHIEPTLVGNESRLVVSELAGRVNVGVRAAQLGAHLDGVIDARELSTLVKELEASGASFEGAEASFELLIRRRQPGYVAPFELSDYTVLVEQRAGTELRAEATVKVRVAGETLHTAADGNGPVNALDAALRKALSAFYPSLAAIRLADYKVRILDGEEATAARTRVVIESVSAGLDWSTMGSDTNIIGASAAALADSFEYAIWKGQVEVSQPGVRDERGKPHDQS